MTTHSALSAVFTASSMSLMCVDNKTTAIERSQCQTLILPQSLVILWAPYMFLKTTLTTHDESTRPAGAPIEITCQLQRADALATEVFPRKGIITCPPQQVPRLSGNPIVYGNSDWLGGRWPNGHLILLETGWPLVATHNSSERKVARAQSSLEGMVCIRIRRRTPSIHTKHIPKCLHPLTQTESPTTTRAHSQPSFDIPSLLQSLLTMSTYGLFGATDFTTQLESMPVTSKVDPIAASLYDFETLELGNPQPELFR
jgi:hypothetical protein